MTHYILDDGTKFGKWTDKVSLKLYGDMSMFVPEKSYKTVADYGGGNGLMEKWFPNCEYVTIDLDKNKRPTIVDNIITHTGVYDLIVIRYVLHYMTDVEIKTMFDNITKFHKGDILVIQFTNDGDDLVTKNNISNLSEEDSRKHMRSTNEVFQLLNTFDVETVTSIKYVVTPDFYKNRLKINTELSHNENIFGILCKRKNE